MSVAFGKLRDYIRAAIQDTDTVIKVYKDQAIDSQISFSLLEFGYTQNPAHVVENDLSLQQQLIFVLKTAIRILAGRPDDFAYRSPVLSVSRRKSVSTLITKLEESLQQAEGGGLVFSSETDITALLNSVYRYVNELSTAS